ncbi:hypothetical protein PYCCODRAFT_1375186 [Trametes coccinea BRFM310]|uniref:Uncharacterized protein n=1 Tax=Trametes coccinea (strain BRFM310) TaxID=1353009 RepID=A0A1Y2ICI7_TRAC3|nr:hypothetical protein PYCCODRAFT_1375186 [Trametes coccinea BRFM310]
MLAVSRRAIATRHATRSLATEAQASSTSTSKRPFRKWNSKGPEIEQQPNTIYVRAWDEIDSMPALFALVRGLEKRFGRIREFRVTRDYDISTSYANFFIAEFADPDAIDRVPTKGTHIKVEVPVVPKHRPGGVGLDQLQGLLQAEDFDPSLATDGVNKPVIKPFETAEEEDSKPTRVVELIIERSKGYKADPRDRIRSRHAGQFGVAFYQWGGFYRPSADEPPVPKAMQEALAKWQRKADSRFKPADHASAPAGDSSRDVEAIALDGNHTLESAEHSPEGQEVQASASSREADPVVVSSASDEPQNSSEAPSAEDQPQRPKRLSQREKILMLARMHAKTPLGDVKAQEEKQIEEEQARARAVEAAKEEQKAAMGSLRDRLLKMLGKSP